MEIARAHAPHECIHAFPRRTHTHETNTHTGRDGRCAGKQRERKLSVVFFSRFLQSNKEHHEIISVPLIFTPRFIPRVPRMQPIDGSRALRHAAAATASASSLSLSPPTSQHAHTYTLTHTDERTIVSPSPTQAAHKFPHPPPSMAYAQQETLLPSSLSTLSLSLSLSLSLPSVAPSRSLSLRHCHEFHTLNFNRSGFLLPRNRDLVS